MYDKRDNLAPDYDNNLSDDFQQPAVYTVSIAKVKKLGNNFENNEWDLGVANKTI